MSKPLGHKAYGSIGHLPGSRTGPGDHTIEAGQADIILNGKPGFVVTASEKIDGSCVSVARVGDDILALGRAGYLCSSAPFEHIRAFAGWVAERKPCFIDALQPGERIVGELINKRIGVPYAVINPDGMFQAFDLMRGHQRASASEWHDRARGLPMGMVVRHEVHHGLHSTPKEWHKWHWGVTRFGASAVCLGEPEGIVYRVESTKNKQDPPVVFLAKWVRDSHTPGEFLKQNVYNQGAPRPEAE